MDGFVDSASLYEIVNYFRLGSNSNKWAMQVSKELGAIFIGAPRVHIMPGFEPHGLPSDDYGQLVYRLADKVRIFEVRPEVQLISLRRTKRWARDQSRKIYETLQQLYTGQYIDLSEDYSPFVEWLTNFFQHNSVEHTLRLKGVFNRTLIPELSLIMQVPRPDLEHVWLMSCDPWHLRQARTLDRAAREDVQIMWDACAVAAMLRGRYHDGIAELSHVQVVHHPVRSPMLKKLHTRPDTIYNATETQQLLATITLHAALREKGTESRVAAWVEIVGATRLLVARGSLDLAEKPTLELAERAAVEAARKVGIPAHGKLVSDALEFLAVLGVGAATSFALTPWEGFAAAAGTATATRIPQVQRVIEFPQRASRRKLRQLAKAPPGRLTRAKIPMDQSLSARLHK
jgi:hypothetical protein